MSERARLLTKPPETKSESRVSKTNNKRSTQPTRPIQSPRDYILHLQRTIGNQAVGRLLKSGVIQAKLKIGKPNDKYEQEADRIADKVMTMPDTDIKQQSSDKIQSKPISEQITPLVSRQEEENEEVQEKSLLQKQEEEDELQEKPLLQRQEDEEESQAKLDSTIQRTRNTCSEEYTQAKIQKRSIYSKNRCPKCKPSSSNNRFIQRKSLVHNSQTLSPDTESGIRSIKGGGQPLPKTTKSFMGNRFGYDFSRVRIHKDSRADNLAGSVNAKAFTLENDIVFKSGQYSPDTSDGKKLLAHELTHVVQQGKGNKVKPLQHKIALIQRKESSNEINGIVTARRLWFRTAPKTVKSNHILRLRRNKTLIILNQNISTLDRGKWGKQRPVWVKVKVGSKIGFIPKNYVDYSSKAKKADKPGFIPQGNIYFSGIAKEKKKKNDLSKVTNIMGLYIWYRKKYPIMSKIFDISWAVLYYYKNFDKQARQILDHWFFKRGKKLVIENDPEWSSYMMKKHKCRSNKITDYYKQCMPYVVSGLLLKKAKAKIPPDKEEISINKQLDVMLDNGYHTGYQLLHGSEATAGGFHVYGKGNFSKNKNGNYNIKYKLTYAWHDIMDPNKKYPKDSVLAFIIRRIPFINPTDYYMDIIWHADSEIKNIGTRQQAKYGWPFVF